LNFFGLTWVDLWNPGPCPLAGSTPRPGLITMIPTWISGATDVQLMPTQLFWIHDSTTYQRSKFQQKKKRCHMSEIWFFKDDSWILLANRFHEETSSDYVPKHLNRHPSFYFSNLTPLSQNLKISCKAISHFLRK